ncbi:hypothetical protein WJX74_010375 [Apatococcus lobatus]|uniref:60S acidic ribosomal protein P3 n=1 Tax=Apatococcus lobatus TaxID=904363 RepID=A0AAW1QBB7_9CHLO
MPSFTFICKEDGGSWSAKRFADEEGESLTAEAGDCKSLQKELLSLAQSQGASGSLAQSYSPISPSSAIYQVVIGGPAAVGGGGGGAAAPAAGGAAAPAAAEAKEEAKEEEEEEDEDMGFSLFD